MFGKDLRKKILESDDINLVPVPLPEWDIEEGVFVKMLTGKERDGFEASLVVGKGKKAKTDMQNVRARLAVRCAVDENGERIFGDEDADMLGTKSAAALERLFSAARKHNKMTEEDIEELAGN